MAAMMSVLMQQGHDKVSDDDGDDEDCDNITLGCYF